MGLDPNTYRSILSLTADEARDFFLKQENYCNFDLPPYFTFEALLKSLNELLVGKDLSNFHEPGKKVRDYDDVNHTLLNNKNGKYAWRPFSLIHPAIYVSLVHIITEEVNWNTIKCRFKDFQSNEKINCFSIPVKSTSNKKDKEEQILYWWENIEQKSIELALDYEHLIQSDITDCYSSIYTHTIVWAIHTKEQSKCDKNKKDFKKQIGSVIDKKLQDMNSGQTNGIPQGSVLMDFIAEIVLGYADLRLSEEIYKYKSITDDYCILRYRDDYKIFTNNPQIGEIIIKLLSEVLSEINLKLNPIKTKISRNIVKDSLKSEKHHWIINKQYAKDIREQLIIIHNFSEKHPNSGGLLKALTKFYKRIYGHKNLTYNYSVLISIITDIAVHNPRTYPQYCAIMSKFLSFVDGDDQKLALLEKVKRRFNNIPNTSHLDLWLQRLTIQINRDMKYKAPLAQLAAGQKMNIWNSDWLKGDIKKTLEETKIVDEEVIKNLDPVMEKGEAVLFLNHHTPS